MPRDGSAHSGAFPTTRWTFIESAGRETVGTQRAWLGVVLRTYLPLLVRHVARKFRVREDEAEEMVHAFVADRLVERNIIRHVDRNRGSKFRSFLLASLDNHIRNRFRAERARKRTPGSGHALDNDDSRAEPIDTSAGPEATVHAEWASQILGETLQRMRAQCEADNRMDLWAFFDGRLRAPLMEGAPEVPYEQLVAQLGLKSPQQAANRLISAKRMYERILREVISEYAGEHVDEEIADLIHTVGGV